MTDTSFVTVHGFKSFTSLWDEACAQISQECVRDFIDNDIKLFALLRAMVLSPEKPTFIRGNKLTDFCVQNNKVRTTLTKYPTNPARISWNHIPQPYVPQRPFYTPTKQPVYKPASVAYLHIGNTKIIEHYDYITIKNDCILKVTDSHTPPKQLYTIIDDDFVARLDNTRVLFPVSQNMIKIFAANKTPNINLKIFKELTEEMYKKLIALQDKFK